MTETLAVNQVARITSAPPSWQTLPLRRLFRITGGATPKSDVAEYWDGDVQWVTPADLGKTPLLEVHTSARTLTRAGLDSCAAELLPPGSIIVSVRAPIGAIGIAKVPMATNQGCKGLVGQSADSKFMAYQLSVSQESLEAIGRGTTFTELSATDLGSFQVAVPPLDLQRTIADFLDRETAKIDALIDKQEQLIATLREDRAATITHAVTKGLKPGVAQAPSGIQWMGDVPAHWEVARLRHHATMKTGHTPSRQKPEFWENTHIPWFTLADVWQLRSGRQIYLGETAGKISSVGLANSAAELLPAGTVILSRTASVGFSGIMPIPMATSQDFWNWICGPSLIPEFLAFVFRAMKPYFDSLMMGSTHQTIYQADAAALQVPLPPVGVYQRSWTTS